MQFLDLRELPMTKIREMLGADMYGICGCL